jgi:hypothetical protein
VFDSHRISGIVPGAIERVFSFSRQISADLRSGKRHWLLAPVRIPPHSATALGRDEMVGPLPPLVFSETILRQFEILAQLDWADIAVMSDACWRTKKVEWYYASAILR